MPNDINEDQTQKRVDVCLFFPSHYNSNSLSHGNVICDEKLIFYNNRRWSHQSVHAAELSGYHPKVNVGLQKLTASLR